MSQTPWFRTDTAASPTTKRLCLLWDSSCRKYGIGFFTDSGWSVVCCQHDFTPTHWSELTGPPGEEE